MWGSQSDNGRNSLVLLFSCLWVAHPADIGFDFIIIEPLLPSFCGFSFVFEVRVSFFVGSRIHLSTVVQQLVAILVLSQEERDTGPSTLPS